MLYFMSNAYLHFKGEKGSKTFLIDEKHLPMALSFIHHFMVEHQFIESLEVFEVAQIKFLTFVFILNFVLGYNYFLF